MSPDKIAMNNPRSWISLYPHARIIKRNKCSEAFLTGSHYSRPTNLQSSSLTSLRDTIDRCDRHGLTEKDLADSHYRPKSALSTSISSRTASDRNGNAFVPFSQAGLPARRSSKTGPWYSPGVIDPAQHSCLYLAT